MDKFSYALVKSAVDTFGARGPVWEIGSYRVEGQEEHGDLRGLFKKVDYVGCDMREGPCVDRREDVTQLSAGDGSLGTLICLNTLEHVFAAHKGFDEIARTVSQEGMAIVNFPFYFKVHDYPGDFWRITPAGLSQAMAAFPWRVVGSVGWETTPTSVFAVGFKSAPPNFASLFEDFLSTLRREARESHGIIKYVKSRLGYHLLSKRLFRTVIHSGRIRAEAKMP